MGIPVDIPPSTPPAQFVVVRTPSGGSDVRLRAGHRPPSETEHQAGGRALGIEPARGIDQPAHTDRLTGRNIADEIGCWLIAHGVSFAQVSYSLTQAVVVRDNSWAD